MGTLEQTEVEIDVTITLRVENATAFRRAAYEQALAEGLEEECASSYLDENAMSLGDCSAILIDPGTSPAGSAIQFSSHDQRVVERLG